MKKASNMLLLFFSFSLTLSCNQPNCSEVINEFHSYENSLELIKSSHFKFSDKCNTSSSSWILNAEYFSCDKETGFLLLTTKTTTYIHQDVPIEIWKEFKRAESFGTYYNQHIKGRFQLELQ